jgi:molybdate transport system ATP-binding protein
VTALSLNLSAERGDFVLAVEADIPAGITGVYGPSGSGKTSLLMRIAGLMRGADTDTVRLGEVLLEDGSTWLPAEQRDVAMVFQDARLFPHLSVADNLAFAHRRRRRDGPSIEQVSDWLGVRDWWQRLPAALSRGQQQRVALARSLVNAPALLLLDEPGANVDPQGRRQMLEVIADVCARQSMSALLVSHDMRDIADTAAQLLVLEHGQLLAQGSVMALAASVEGPLARQPDAAAIVEGRVEQHNSQYGLTEVSVGGQTLWTDQTSRPRGSTVRLRLPARDISLCREAPRATSILNVLPTEVTAIEAGDDNRVLVQLRLGDQYLLARITRMSLEKLGLQVGERVFAQLKSTALIDTARGIYDE